MERKPLNSHFDDEMRNFITDILTLGHNVREPVAKCYVRQMSGIDFYIIK